MYSAVAQTVVKAMVIRTDDFIDNMPREILKRMEKDAYRKLFKLRENMESENKKMNFLKGMDAVSKNQAFTINHMQQIYPCGTLNY